jgi:serine protease AprX
MGASSRYRGRGITIALVDSGFYPHDDLIYPANRILAIYDAVRGRQVRNIGRLRNQSPPVEAWHGTMTAAVAAGNGTLSRGYYRGIASEANLVLIKTMTPKYRIQTPQVVRALEWVLAHYRQYGIRIVNLSLGVDEVTDSLDHPVVALVEELVERGVVVVAASGNNPFQPLKPPGWAPSAITVGGYNDNNSTEWMRRELWHSSYGSTHGGARKPELLAPAIWLSAPILPNTGVKREAEALFALARASEGDVMAMVPHLADHTGIAALLRAAKTPLRVHSAVFRRIHDEKLINPSYKHVDGTSFAAPIISSIIAQMLEARPNLTPAEVKDILTSSAALLPNAPPESQGFGIVQAEMAIDVTLALTPPPGSDRLASPEKCHSES